MKGRRLQLYSYYTAKKRSDIALWDACHIHKHGTMWRWWKYISRKDSCDRDQSQSECIDDVGMIKAMSGVSKELKTQGRQKIFLHGLQPTPDQRRTLNLILKVTCKTGVCIL